MNVCSTHQCTKIIEFDEIVEFHKHENKNNNNKNYLDFADAIYIMTVKKNKLTDRQIDSIKNINILGCKNKTFWCETLGYKHSRCVFNDVNENIMYNAKKIIKHALNNNYENIIIFEDDFIFDGNIHKKLHKKNKIIKQLLLENNNTESVIYLGYIPLTIKHINDDVITGRFGNGHALLINKKAQQKILNYNFDKKTENINGHFDYDGLSMGLDTALYLDKSIKHLALSPNDLFFQKNEPNSNIGNTKNISLNVFFRIQQMFTGEMYYQYSPKFVYYYEKFIQFISQFYDEKEPAIIMLHNNLKYNVIYFTIVVMFFILFYYKIYGKSYNSLLQNMNPMLYIKN